MSAAFITGTGTDVGKTFVAAGLIRYFRVKVVRLRPRWARWNQWAHIEHVLDLIIWDLSGLEPSKGALSITAQLLGSQARFKTIISLAQTRRLSKAIITRATNLKDSVQARAEKRNRIVHDPWYAEQTTQSSAQFKNVPPSKSKNYSFGMKPTDTKYINAAIKEGKKTFKEVAALRNAILKEI